MTKPKIIRRIPDKYESRATAKPSPILPDDYIMYGYNQAIDDLEPLEIDVEKLASAMYQDDGYYTENEWIDLEPFTKKEWLRLAQTIKTAIESGEILKEVEK